jgi:hypothetical protein
MKMDAQPTNAAMLVGCLSENQRLIAEKVLKGGQTLHENLLELRYWKIKMWFKKPTSVVLNCRRHSEPKLQHIFHKFGRTEHGSLIYMPRKSRVRFGFYFSEVAGYEDGNVDRYDVIFPKPANEFTFEKFKAKFDMRFVTEARLQELWSGKSGQTGCQYARSDFRHIGREGKWVLERFLKRFTNVASTDTTHYLCSDREGCEKNYRLYEFHTSSGRQSSRFGRDIKIEHLLGNSLVWYSSEFPGCGNGSYGMLVNEKTWLHLEDD